MKTILITGGVGFIGTNACKMALRYGHKVIAFDNLIRKGVVTNILKHKNYKFIEGDVRKPANIKKVGKVDAIIHLAANAGIPWSIKDPVYDFNCNAVGTLNILEYARKNNNCPVIFASTNKVYSDSINKLDISEWRTRYIYGISYDVPDGDRVDEKGNPIMKHRVKSRYWNGIDEDFPIDGFGKFSHSPYGVSKLTADLLCQEYWQTFQVPTVINRQSCVYGKHQHGVADQGWVSWFMMAKIFGKKLTIYGDGKQVRDALYGEDLAKLYMIELDILWSKDKEKMAGKVFNVGGGYKNTISLLEAIELIDRIDNNRHPKLEIEYEDWRHADHKVFYCNIDRIAKYWTPTTNVPIGFNNTYEWLLENQDLLKQFIEEK